MMVVRQLLEEEQVSVLGLGEVTPQDVTGLREACKKVGDLKFIVDAKAGRMRRHGVGMIYDAERVDLLNSQWLEVVRAGQQLPAGLEGLFRVRRTRSLLRVFAVHWPSRMRGEEARRQRELLGSDLQRKLASSLRLGEAEQAASLGTLVMGDFNAEPFEEALAGCLLASRDRSLVRKREGMLYNPFWRLLGERQHLEEEGLGRLAAGTCYYKNNLDSHWYTFDQILVSASLLRDAGLRLWEGATRIHQRPPLLTDKGRPYEDFDHLPVMVTLASPQDTADGETNDD